MTRKPNILTPSSESLYLAAQNLRLGKLVAFPTETVYGLGGDATNDRAIASIYAAKGRPQFNPLIVHIADKKEAPDLVIWNKSAEKLADTFWPGPLTLVLSRAPDSPIALLASAGLDTIAIRCPDHPIAQQLIEQTQRPLAAPSANASGKLSTTCAQHVQDSLGEDVSLILDGGPCPVGVESTVLDMTSKPPTLLRHGGVTKEQLEAYLGEIQESLHDESAPKSPGMLLSHYAPTIPLRLDAQTASEEEAVLLFGDEEKVKGGGVRLNLSAKGDLTEAAANLFAMLHQLDQEKFKGIAVAPIPQTGLGAAINDRLRRAATK
ncbi:MAG TPA: threonylcarbamoyl-AMP synthase [Rhodospirillaceae bacterium]|nr:threonylcarbamoyl-AMP synthase [Rhodospirillaceae bacterium]